MNIILYESEYPVQTKEELDKYISRAEADAHEKKILSMIFLKADNGNEMGITVSGVETVLSFVYGSLKPPYYASEGQSDAEEPVMTAYANFTHHSEFPRKFVIPYSSGIESAYEFFKTNELPTCVEWMEV